MPTYHNCQESEAGKDLIEQAKVLVRSTSELLDLELKAVRIDFVFAYCDRDENNYPINDALKKNGVRALSITRVLNLKDRSKGMGDAEICIDHDWWMESTEAQRAALLDHELTHIIINQNRDGVVVIDALGRPKLKLRKHDYEFGWFRQVAQRHGVNSMERIQAKQILDEAGQLLFPELLAHNEGRMGKLEQKVKK